jgi:hypothetical protein
VITRARAIDGDNTHVLLAGVVMKQPSFAKAAEGILLRGEPWCKILRSAQARSRMVPRGGRLKPQPYKGLSASGTAPFSIAFHNLLIAIVPLMPELFCKRLQTTMPVGSRRDHSVGSRPTALFTKMSTDSFGG